MRNRDWERGPSNTEMARIEVECTKVVCDRATNRFLGFFFFFEYFSNCVCVFVVQGRLGVSLFFVFFLKKPIKHHIVIDGTASNDTRTHRRRRRFHHSLHERASLFSPLSYSPDDHERPGSNRTCARALRFVLTPVPCKRGLRVPPYGVKRKRKNTVL